MTEEQIINGWELLKKCGGTPNEFFIDETLNLINSKNAEAKSEAIKEVAERLKEYVEANQVQTTFFGNKCFIDKDTIDNLLKEKVGENK